MRTRFSPFPLPLPLPLPLQSKTHRFEQNTCPSEGNLPQPNGFITLLSLPLYDLRNFELFQTQMTQSQLDPSFHF